MPEPKYAFGAKVRSVQHIDRVGTIKEVAPNPLFPGFLYGVNHGSFIERYPEDAIEPADAPLVWRDDNRSQELPTVNYLVIHSDDRIEGDDTFTLYVSHVNSFPRGKGFRPIVKSVGSIHSGPFFMGQSADVHIKATIEGFRMLAEAQKRLEEEMEKLKP